jgi:hypothetical protein
MWRETLSQKKEKQNKVSRWENIYHANINQKKAGVVILNSYNVHFRARKLPEIEKNMQ